MSRRRIHVKIGALAVEGVSRVEAEGLAASLRAELGRLFAAPATAATTAAALAAAPARRVRLDAGTFPSALGTARGGVAPRAAAAVSDGARIAASVYSGLRLSPGAASRGRPK